MSRTVEDIVASIFHYGRRVAIGKCVIHEESLNNYAHEIKSLIPPREKVEEMLQSTINYDHCNDISCQSGKGCLSCEKNWIDEKLNELYGEVK